MKDISSGIRAIRKDGNCFYRAFSFRLADLLLSNFNSPWYHSILQNCISSKSLLSQVGYDEIAYEDFFEIFMEALKPPVIQRPNNSDVNLHSISNSFSPNLEDSPNFSSQDLVARLSNDYVGESMICYLRLVTAAILKTNKEVYEPFVLGSGEWSSIDEFISTQVEPSK